MNRKKLLLALTLSGVALLSSLNLNAGIPVSPEYLSKKLDSIRTTSELWARTCTAGHDLKNGCSTADLSMTASSADAQKAWFDILQATGLVGAYGVTAEHMINSGSTVVVKFSGEDFGTFGPTVTLGSGGNGGNGGAVAYVDWLAFTASGDRVRPIVNSQGYDTPVYPHALVVGVESQYSPVGMFNTSPAGDFYVAFTAFNDRGDLVKLSSGSIEWRRS